MFVVNCQVDEVITKPQPGTHGTRGTRSKGGETRRQRSRLFVFIIIMDEVS